MARTRLTSLAACALGYAFLIALISWLLLQKPAPLDSSGNPEVNVFDWLLFCVPVGLGIIALVLAVRSTRGALNTIVLGLAVLVVVSPVWAAIGSVVVTCVVGHQLGVAICSGLP